MPAMDPTPLPRPRESFRLLCVRCGAALFYVHQDRARGVPEHHFACRRCGQKHAAWERWKAEHVGAASILHEHRRSRNRNRSRQESDRLALDFVVLARNLTKPILVNSHPGRVRGRS